MRPKRWIHPEDDRDVRDGDLRIIRLANGTVRATIWTQHRDSPYGYYADSQGEGVGDPRGPNEVVAVGVTWDKPRKRKPSGPSGKHLVPQRAVRIPDELWSRFGETAASHQTDRNTVINQLVADYCAAK